MPNKIESPMDNNSNSRVFVWDIPVRLFHWALVLLMVALVVTGKFLDGAIDQHAVLGQSVIALVIFRLLWGIVGSSYARFSQFVCGPLDVLAYVRSLFTSRHEFSVGHNPLGGWMVVVLLIVVLFQAVLGLFSNDDILFDGPLSYLISKESSDLITGLHSDLFNILLVLVALHVSAVIWHKLFKGEDLLSAMFSGYKELPTGMQAKNATGGGALLAIVLLGASASMVFWLTV
jgi:cytochrome b